MVHVDALSGLQLVLPCPLSAAITRTATDPFTGATVNDAPLLTLIPEVGIEARVSGLRS